LQTVASELVKYNSNFRG